jgi:hypothetical protein
VYVVGVPPINVELIHLLDLFDVEEVRNLEVVLLHELVDVSFGVDEGDFSSLEEVREPALLAHGQ